jgi:hypothetical protein
VIFGKQINMTAGVAFAADEMFATSHEEFFKRTAPLGKKAQTLAVMVDFGDTAPGKRHATADGTG